MNLEYVVIVQTNPAMPADPARLANDLQTALDIAVEELPPDMFSGVVSVVVRGVAES